MTITGLLKPRGMISLTAAISFLLVGSISRSINIPLHDGGILRIKPASFWGRYLSGKCSVVCQSKDGVSGIVAFTDNPYSGPFVVIPSDDDKIILCLYDLEDMGLRLVRIDTTQNFKPFSPGSHLNEIIQSSPWEVEQGNAQDWKRMYDVLSAMSPDGFKRESVPGLDLGILRISRRREATVQGVKDQLSLVMPSVR